MRWMPPPNGINSDWGGDYCDRQERLEHRAGVALRSDSVDGTYRDFRRGTYTLSQQIGLREVKQACLATHDIVPQAKPQRRLLTMREKSVRTSAAV